jgi:hypothetical protein
LTTAGDEVANAIELPEVPMSEQDLSTDSQRGTCRVFITYSHDSPEHRRRVLALAERLRKDGVDAYFDQYVAGTPAKGWPRWMEDRLEWAQFVLVICTETYQRRFLGREEPGKGKGVDWEGSFITLEMYHARSATSKFVPVLFDLEDKRFIPGQLSGHTYYLLSSEDNYAKLYAFLTGQAGVVPGKLGPLKTRAREAVEPLTFAGRGEVSPSTGRLDEVPGALPGTPASGTGLLPSESKIPASDEEPLDQKRRKEIRFYAVMALISFLCGVAILSLMLWLARLGLASNLFYFILFPMGIAGAGVLFGVLRSYALSSGKKLGRRLELSGSVVAFLLIVILGSIPGFISNEIKIGDKVFLRSQQGSHVMTAQVSKYNWPRLGNEDKVILTLLGNGPLRHGSVVQIQSLEDNLHGNDVLGAFAESKDCYYLKRSSNDARQEWRIVKLNPSDPVLRYGDKIYLENVYYANKRLTQDPEREDYLTVDEEVDSWWMLEKR